MKLRIRDATPADAAACAAIYRPYVLDTAITFETDPPTVAEMSARITAATRTHAWLVAEFHNADEGAGESGGASAGDNPGAVIGYAYAGPFAARPAYRWACEVSVYLDGGRRRTGAGRALYQALLPRLVERGCRVAVAKTTQPNEPSMAFHAAFGFQLVGVHPKIGYKNGAWHDVAITQLDLAPPGIPAEG
jgi:L-amino acid N-acyltransferase YncA